MVHHTCGGIAHIDPSHYGTAVFVCTGLNGCGKRFSLPTVRVSYDDGREQLSAVERAR